MKIKICGITNLEDLGKAVYYGASSVGFVFHKKSPRYVSPSKARKLVEALPPFVTPVGVFVNLKEKAIKDICRFTRIHTVQLHGDEDMDFCRRLKEYKIIKGFRVNDKFDMKAVNRYKVDAYLFDAYQEDSYGGTGKCFQWRLLEKVKFERPVILSGGLTPENVAEAIQIVEPFCVDVSSGVERIPGVKDPKKIRAFTEAVGTL